jgi:hypothetical protein
MADIFSIAAWLRLKPQPAVMPLMTVRESAAALRCQFADKLAVDILRSALDRTKPGRLTAKKRDIRRSGSLKVPKPGTQGKGTFEVLNGYVCNTVQAAVGLGFAGSRASRPLFWWRKRAISIDSNGYAERGNSLCGS